MIDEQDIEPSAEDLDVSMTQPPLILFVPYEVAVGLGVGAFAIGTKFHTWKIFLAAPVLWTLAAVLVKRDPHAIDVLKVKVRLLRVWTTAYLWDGWSFKLPAPRRAKGGQ